KQRRVLPVVYALADRIPIDFLVLGEDEDNRAVIEGQIGAAMGRVRADVGLVGFIEGRQGFVGGLTVVVFGFVVEQGYLEMLFFGGLLEQSEVVIGKGAAGA